MRYKTTNKLFRGTYQYKIVLVCAGASVFRNNDMEYALKTLGNYDLNSPRSSINSIRNKDQLDYAIELANALSKLDDIEVRVESPWISVYTNYRRHIDTLSNIDQSKVKYISLPPDGVSIQENTILLPNVDYDYRVTIGRTRHENSAFIQWAESNSSKVKITRACKRDLSKDRSWGGSYFYITGEKLLLVAKMHLGDSISKIERIIKK